MRKNKNYLLMFLVAAGLPILLSCTLNIAGGNSSETTDVVAYVYTSKGQPAAGVMYSFTKRESWFRSLVSAQPLTVQDGHTDEHGRILFNRTELEDCNIQISSTDEGAFVYKANSLLHNDTVSLTGYKRIEGTITGAPVKHLFLGGTDYSTVVTEGKFVFEKIPQGRFPVAAQLSDSSSSFHITTSLDPDSLAQILQIQTDRIIYDDFDDKDIFPNVMDALSGSSWYWNSNNAQIIQPSSDQLFEQAILPGNNEQGFSIQTRYIDNNEAPSVQIGSIICRTGFLDFSSLDSIVVWAKGDGNLLLALEKVESDGSAIKASYTLNITSIWARFAISPDSTNNNPYDASMVPWAQIKTTINVITFFASQGSEFGVDGIEFVGLKLEELAKSIK